jgi:hypothetical protein
LTQSILYEDISPFLNAIASAVQNRTNGRTIGQFTVQYWGQAEYIKLATGNGIT